MSETPENLPDSPILRHYYKLRFYLGVDTIELDKAYMELPRIVEEAGVLAAKADAEETAAKHTYDVIRADAAVRLRSILIHGKEPSEARITSMLPLENDVQETRHALDEAHYQAEVCQVLYKALESQMRLLPKAADMAMSGYMSPSVALDQRRSEMRQARLSGDRQIAQREGPRIGRPTS